MPGPPWAHFADLRDPMGSCCLTPKAGQDSLEIFAGLSRILMSAKNSVSKGAYPQIFSLFSFIFERKLC